MHINVYYLLKDLNSIQPCFLEIFMTLKTTEMGFCFIEIYFASLKSFDNPI